MEDNEKSYTFAEKKKKTREIMNEKLQINVYKGLPIVLEKIKTVALAAVIGKGGSWINNKFRHNEIKGKAQEFVPSDLTLINNGLQMLGDEICQNMVQFSANREEVIEQIKVLSNYISMPYIYNKVMGKPRLWYSSRMLDRAPGRKVCVFKEDDILQINMAAMQIANELKSIELTL